MAFAADSSPPDEGDDGDLEEYENIKKAANEIKEKNYKTAYDLLATETEIERGPRKEFRNPSVLLNQLAEESSFDYDEVPKCLSALAHDFEGLYEFEEAEEKVKSFAKELKDSDYW